MQHFKAVLLCILSSATAFRNMILQLVGDICIASDEVCCASRYDRTVIKQSKRVRYAHVCCLWLAIVKGKGRHRFSLQVGGILSSNALLRLGKSKVPAACDHMHFRDTTHLVHITMAV